LDSVVSDVEMLMHCSWWVWKGYQHS